MTWEDAWKEGRTPWDAGESPPVLVELVESSTLPAGSAVVPGAGSGYDVLTLAGPTRRVIGLDLAQHAVARFEALREEAGVPPEHAQMVRADFFEWEPDAPVDLVWDYTFLCALEPDRRGEWARRMDRILGPAGELVTLIFPMREGDPAQGPPYPLEPEAVRALLEPFFEPVVLAPVERSRPSRQGLEWLGRWRRR